MADAAEERESRALLIKTSGGSNSAGMVNGRGRFIEMICD